MNSIQKSNEKVNKKIELYELLINLRQGNLAHLDCQNKQQTLIAFKNLVQVIDNLKVALEL